MSVPTPSLFISHKHSDARIADVLGTFIEAKSTGRVKVHLSSNPDFEGPRFGKGLNAQLRQALWNTDVLILLYTSADQRLKFLDVPISLKSIVEIRLSPWLNSRLRHSLKDTIHSIAGCKDLVVHRSTLIGNTTWKKFADRAS